MNFRSYFYLVTYAIAPASLFSRDNNNKPKFTFFLSLIFFKFHLYRASIIHIYTQMWYSHINKTTLTLKFLLKERRHPDTPRTHNTYSAQVSPSSQAVEHLSYGLGLDHVV